MSISGIVALALVVAVVVIGMKVRDNTQKIKELDEILGSQKQPPKHGK